MAFFDKSFPEKLTTSILPSQVVSKLVRLKKRGKEFHGLCPFHNEKTPSFTVNDQKGFYHCFGCHEHGNIIDFVMKTQNLEFKDAVVNLADDFGFQIQWQENLGPKKNAQQDKDYEILEKICQVFEENLQNSFGASARNYLINRGFNHEIIKKFRLGFAPDSYNFLHEKLSKNGFTRAQILETGIIAKNSSQNIYDKLRNRVVFPIFDKKDKVIAFGGRILGQGNPKYLNSAETKIFKKSQTLYNFSFAKKHILSKKYAVIVEGYADVIGLYKSGIKNVVAGLGTALGKYHILDLFRITDKVIICFDGDEAGFNAAKRVCEIVLPLIGSKKSVDFAFLPKDIDPDDYVKRYGAKSMVNLLENESVKLSQSLFEFTLKDLNVNLNNKINPEDKAKIESDLMAKIENIQDPITKRYFSQFYRDLLFKIGRNNKFALKSYQKIESSIKKANLTNKNNENEIISQNIIAFMLKFPALVNYYDEEYDIKEIELANEELTEIKDKIVEICEEFDENSDYDEKKMLITLENYCKNDYISNIGALRMNISGDQNDQEIITKMRLLLLKQSFLLIQEEYRHALSKIDEIDTHQTAVIDQRITEIFSYKNKLELEILKLEKELI